MRTTNCGEIQQRIKHIIVDCLRRRVQGNLKEFIELTKEAVDWITNLEIYSVLTIHFEFYD